MANEARTEAAGEVTPAAREADATSMPLTYRTHDDVGTEVHTPMFEAPIGSQRQLFVVDTGATDSIFAKRVAVALGSSLRDDEPGTDHAGSPVPTWIASPDFQMDLGSRQVVFSPTMVIEAPQPFAKWGIGGIVSPQNLDSKAVLVLDLVENELSIRAQPLNAVVDTVTERRGRDPLRLPRDATTHDATKLVVVRGKTPDQDSLRILINTGGREVEIDPAACGADTNEQAQIRGRGLSGDDVVGSVLAEQAIVLGDRRFTYKQVTVRPQGVDYDAQLGIGALRNTVLVISADPRDPVLWWVENETSD